VTAKVHARVEGEVVIGIVLMSASALIVPGLDAIAKYLTIRIPALELAFLRFLASTIVIAIYAALTGQLRTLWPRQVVLQLLRGVAIGVTSVFFFAAVKIMPIADALAIAYVEPVIVVMLSAFVLNETVGRKRWIACLIGLVGTLVIVRPSIAVFGWQALLPLASAVSFALYHLSNRALAGQSTITGAMFMTSLGGTLSLGPALVLTTWFGFAGQIAVVPDLEAWLFILGMVAIALVSHSLSLRAYNRAGVAVLAPLGYLELISATILGYIFFDTLPTWPTWIGMALIAGGGVYSILVERHEERHKGGLIEVG
jgi:drug/metabolite transporter (DMT)-like permease